MLEERSQPTGAYIFYTTNLFRTNVFNYFIIPFRIPITYAPDFLFLRLIFTTPFRDSHSQLQLATHVRDPHSQLAVSQPPRHATPPLMDGLCQHPSVNSLAFQP